MIKLNKCGDDKSIPKEIHDKIKSCTNSIMDFDQDVKWYDVYSMFEEIFKDGKKLATKKGETNYKESLTDILDYLEETESDREDDDEVSERILKDVKNLRKLEGEL